MSTVPMFAGPGVCSTSVHMLYAQPCQQICKFDLEFCTTVTSDELRHKATAYPRSRKTLATAANVFSISPQILLPS
jgi:hypothetical protein